MKITLKKFVANQRFSEETLMFRADVYVDGKKAGSAENDGRGGPTWVHWIDRALGEQVSAWIKALPPESSLTYDEDGLSCAETGKPPAAYAQDEDSYFSRLAEEALRAKDEKRIAARRQKFISEAKARGGTPFVASLSDRSDLMFTVSGSNSALDYATSYAKKHGVTCLKVEEMR